MRVILNDDKICITNCTIEDIINSIQGLKLLSKSVLTIKVQANFDFDTKYYHKFDEEFINNIYRKTYNDLIYVELKNNRLYYNGLILPIVDKIQFVYILPFLSSLFNGFYWFRVSCYYMSFNIQFIK